MSPPSSAERFEQEARRVAALLPRGPRLAVIGSTSFWHPQSERTCGEIGRLLAEEIPELVLLTGGVEGVGETVGRSFHQTCLQSMQMQEPVVYHLLPEGEETWDYGQTIFAGADMSERREILARLAELFLAVEGGPGTVHEAEVAAARGAVIVPIGRSGGHAGVLYHRVTCPAGIDADLWRLLGDEAATPEDTARVAVSVLRGCLVGC